MRSRLALAQTQEAKMGRLETKERKWLPWLSHPLHQSRPGRGPRAVWAPPGPARQLSRPQGREAAGRALWGSGEGAGLPPAVLLEGPASTRPPVPTAHRVQTVPRAGLNLTPLRAVRRGVEAREQEKLPKRPSFPEPRWARAAAPHARRPPGQPWSLLPGNRQVRPSRQRWRLLLWL